MCRGLNAPRCDARIAATRPSIVVRNRVQPVGRAIRGRCVPGLIRGKFNDVSRNESIHTLAIDVIANI
jgi:hypothetical protein